jgi:hypothetical protein
MKANQRAEIFGELVREVLPVEVVGREIFDDHYDRREWILKCLFKDYDKNLDEKQCKLLGKYDTSQN